MNEKSQYPEYNEAKNRVPWLRILISFLILILAVIIVLLLLKACQKTSLREDLIDAAKEYYQRYPERLPSTVAECFVITLEQLENEGLIKSSDYDICDKETTYVNVCHMESGSYHYSAILECGEESTNYGVWKDGIETNINENSDIRFTFLGEERNLGTKYYYPNDVTDINEVKEYYATIPATNYTGKEDEQIGYKWYTEKTVNNYWNNGEYSSTQPSGYPNKGTSITKTNYSLDKPSSASYRIIEETTLYRTQKVAYPIGYICPSGNGVIVSSEPCDESVESPVLAFSCNGTDLIDVTAEQIINRDFPPCGEWSEWTTQECTTSFTGGIKCQSDDGYKYTDTMWKWYRKDNVKSYYPSGSATASGEKTYYVTMPTNGAKKDNSTQATVYKYYKLEQNTTADTNYEEWVPITDGYVFLDEMLEAFRLSDYEVYSLADINRTDGIRYTYQMQYRDLEE